MVFGLAVDESSPPSSEVAHEDTGSCSSSSSAEEQEVKSTRGAGADTGWPVAAAADSPRKPWPNESRAKRPPPFGGPHVAQDGGDDATVQLEEVDDRVRRVAGNTCEEDDEDEDECW